MLGEQAADFVADGSVLLVVKCGDETSRRHELDHAVGIEDLVVGEMPLDERREAVARPERLPPQPRVVAGVAVADCATLLVRELGPTRVESDSDRRTSGSGTCYWDRELG